MADANKLGLNELRRILDITDAFASLAETHMGKSVATLQAPIQQSCKAALDLMHAANITQLNCEYISRNIFSWILLVAWHFLRLLSN